MHELSVCRALLDQVVAIAARHGASHIASITLHIGPLAGVDPELLRAAYHLACVHTIAAGAALNIGTAPLRVLCNQCGEQTDATVNRLTCGRCGDWRTQVLSGDELTLVSLELAT